MGLFLFPAEIKRDGVPKQKLMADEAVVPAGQTATETPATASEPVRDAEAVLKQNAELLSEIKRLKKATQATEGIDIAEYKALKEAAAKAEEEHLIKKGEFEELLKQKEKAWNERLTAETTAKEQILVNLKRERLTNKLTEKGVMPDRAKYLVQDLDAVTELVATDNGFQIRKIGGIGDAAEFDALIENAKLTSPFFFAASTTSGSGAQGSVSNNGSGKTLTRDAFSKMTPHEQAAFSKEVIAGKATLTD